MFLVRLGGIEPPHPFGPQILSLPRLPFRHSRIIGAQGGI